MSGHSKWKTIKHKKEALDQKRGKIFSKLASNISVAARNGVDPQFNPALRSAMDQARRQKMPRENIMRAIEKATEKNTIKSLIIESYGPGGVGILIEASTDNHKRTISEIRSILKKCNARIAEPGSLMWSFEKTDTGYSAKFPQDVNEEIKEKVENLLKELGKHPDVIKTLVTI